MTIACGAKDPYGTVKQVLCDCGNRNTQTFVTENIYETNCQEMPVASDIKISETFRATK